jgi:flavin-dependent dehydrogenase
VTAVERCDVVIVGAGPAGSAAARLLAAWHHRVVLLHRPVSTPSLAESLPPSCRALFHACGLDAAIDGASFYRSTGNTVWWGTDEARRELFGSAAHGYQIDRAPFDALLRGEAVAAGADLREALVREVREERFVLDCSGRAGVVARRRWRRDIPGHPRTVALAGVWTAPRGWPLVDPTHTLVESYADGWAWSVPLSPNVRHVTAMVDPQRTQLARGRPAADVYRAELAKARHIASLLAQGTLDRGPWGCDASVYAADIYAGDPFLLVGDAASFVDPLSSYGVKKALASAWLAAVAVHTALRTPAMTDTAFAFFAAREAEMASSLLGQSQGVFAQAATTHLHAFWSDRATEAASGARAGSDADVLTLRDDPRVRRAFMWLKEQPAIALRASPALRREPQPVVRGNQIVIEERLASEACPGGFRFVRDVDLAGVVALAPSHDQVPSLFEAYNRRFPPVGLPDFLGALSMLVAFDLLEDSGASGG